MHFDHEDEYVGERFEQISLAEEEIDSKEFEGCTFRGCSFNGSFFRDCKFLSCKFEDCELNLVRVYQSSFAAVSFVRCKVLGINWTDAYWSKKGLLNSLNFAECALNHSTFMGLDLKKMKLTSSTARDVDFTEANLTDADFSGTDFSQSRFNHTNLTRADFRGATNYAISAQFNTVKDAHFNLPEAMSLLYGLNIHLDD